MTMKKLIASVIAGAVAVSAMATSAFAEETKAFDTYTTTTSYSGQATFTVANPTSDKIVVTIADGNADVDFTYAVADVTIDGTKYEGDNVNLYTSVASNEVTITPIGTADGKAISMTVNATVDTGADKANATAFDSATATVTDGTIAITNILWKASTKSTTSKNYMAVPRTLTSIATGFTGLDKSITNYIGSNTGAKLVVNFKDMEAADEATTSETDPTYTQDVAFSSTTTADDLGIMINGSSKLSSAASIDADALTVSFDWDTLLADSNITNAIGEIDSIELIAKNALVETFTNDSGATVDKYVITGFTVVMDDAAVTEATTTADATTDATTDDSNPETGAAPVALALIPAALAAVVIAKKRK